MTGRTYEDILFRGGTPPDYRPKEYQKFVRIISDDTGPEHIRVLPVPEQLAVAEHGRCVEVTSDTTLCMNNLTAMLHSDGMFMWNALMCAVREHRTAAELRRFGSGNLPQHVTRVTLNTWFTRSLQALDAWSVKASGSPLVQRSSWGSGAGITYGLMDDISVVDRRQ